MTDLRGRMGTPFHQALANRLTVDPQPAENPSGKSGYFTRPVPGMDPRIVDPNTEKVWPALREAILNTLYTFWGKRYRNPREWSTVWIAGSALSHQWSADRGNADLDILIGVNHPKFFEYNREFIGLPEDDIDSRFNKEFDNELEVQTKDFLGSYEMTFYVNPGATDIRAISPYAAYDLNHDRWTVKPIELPADWDPRTYFPKEWWAKWDSEIVMAKALSSRYHQLANQLKAQTVGSPQWDNTLNLIKRTVLPQASALFDDIHKGRTQAFAPGGSGYKDYFNARWQAHKEAGTTEILHALKAIDVHAHIENQENVYGEPLLGSQDALTVASLWNTPYRRTAIEQPSTGPAAPQERL